MKKSALLPLLSLCLLAQAAHADEREWLSYPKLIDVSRLDKFYAIPASERDKVKLFVTINPEDKSIKPADIVLTAVHSGGRQVLPVSPDYRLDVAAPNPKWLAEDAHILTSLPKDKKSGIGWDMITPLPDGTQWHYATVMSSVDQGNHAIKKMAGIMSMLAPTVKFVTFKFNKPAQLKIDAKDGVKQYNSDAKGQIKVKVDTALLKENPLMTASERPTEAELQSE